MKKLALLSLLSLFFVACEKLDGTLNVVDSLTLKSSKGNQITIKPGGYNTELKINSSKKITLNLLDSKFEFNIPKGTLPDNGEFSLKSAVSGQSVDIKGIVKTVVTKSEIRQTHQSCTVNMPVRICYPVPQGGQECRTEYQPRPGIQLIAYYDQRTDRDVTLNISKAKMTEIAADFFGQASYMQRIVVNQGMCH